MKKIIFLSAVLMAMTLTACDNTSEEVVATDEATLDATVTDEVPAVDVDTMTSDTDTIVAE